MDLTGENGCPAHPIRSIDIGRFIVRNLSIEDLWKSSVDSEVIATAPDYKPAENATPSEETLDVHTLKVRTHQHHTVQRMNTDMAKLRVAGDPVMHEHKARITSFKSHVVHKEDATVEIRLMRADGSGSWESERDLQQEVPDLVYDYWERAGGR